MSANSQLRAALDQLMGSCEQSSNLKYSDQSVCKAYLHDCCPADVLSGTRLELGQCPGVHSLALRSDFQKTEQSEFIREALSTLTQFIRDSDRRTEQARKKLTDQSKELESGECKLKREEIQKLEKEIGEGLLEAEELGSSGQIEESLSKLQHVELLREKKSAAELEYKKSIPPATIQQQKLRVCDVCSSYLGIDDNDRRLADHFGGRLHLGFIKLREAYSQLGERLAAAEKDKGSREKREESRDERRDHRHGHRRHRHDEDDSRRGRHRDRRRDDERDSHRRRRSRS